MSGLLGEINLYRFSSREMHVPSGLVYYIYRYYDSDLQRWINRDPIGENGETTLYSFVRNNPVARIDAVGLTDEECCASGGEEGKSEGKDKKKPEIPDRDLEEVQKKIKDHIKDLVDNYLAELGGDSLKDAKKSCDDLKCMKEKGQEKDANWVIVCQSCAAWKCARKHFNNPTPIFMKNCLNQKFNDCLGKIDP